jgi:hypothetical protein
MIRSFEKICGAQVKTTDGAKGTLQDIYFDDRSWKIRFIVVGTMFEHGERSVVAPPDAVAIYDGTCLTLKLTNAELQIMPDAESSKPVSLHKREASREQYNYNKDSLAGEDPHEESSGIRRGRSDVREKTECDSHLRSCRYISRYKLIASDGHAGSIRDFLIDDSLWLIRFAVAQVGMANDNCEILLGPQLIENVEWALEAIKIPLTSNNILSKPRFFADRHLDVSYESLVNDMYRFADYQILNDQK